MKKIVVLFSIVILFGCSPTMTPVVNIKEVKEYSGKNKNLFSYQLGGIAPDIGVNVVKFDQEKYFICGHSRSFADSTDMFIIESDSKGVLKWGKTFGGGNKEEMVMTLRSKSDNLLLLGQTISLFFTGLGKHGATHYAFRPILIHLDTLGEIQWARTLSSVPMVSVANPNDGGYVMVGEEYSNTFWSENKFGQKKGFPILKYDYSGNIEWAKIYALNGEAWVKNIIPTDDNGFLISGAVFRDERPNGLIIKTNKKGELLWAKQIPKEVLFFKSIQLATGDYLFTGRLYKEKQTDIALVKTNKSGDIKFFKVFGGNKDDTPSSISELKNEKILITGSTSSTGEGDQDGLILEADTNGKLEKLKLLGGKLGDAVFSAVSDNSGNQLLLGASASFSSLGYHDVFFTKINLLDGSKSQIGNIFASSEIDIDAIEEEMTYQPITIDHQILDNNVLIQNLIIQN